MDQVDKLIIGSSKLVTMAENDTNQIIDNGAMAVKNGNIVDIDTTAEILKRYPLCSELVNAENKLILPGFVDCHTHLVYAGSRTKEWEMRLAGKSYLEILQAGGGIHSTVEATRKASQEELYDLAMDRLRAMAAHGTTSLEIKSGYGLNYQTEKKILEVIQQLKRDSPLDILSTYLGAHTIPKDISREEYMDWLLGPTLKEFRKYADFFDVFCEEGAFSKKETEELFHQANKAGFKLKLHGGQFNDLEASGMAASLGAISVDHLEKISDEQISMLSKNKTVAVLLPGVPFYLNNPDYADGRALIDNGVDVALSTDFNPGSCPCYSQQNILTLALLKCGLTHMEALRGITINGAKAINTHKTMGSLERGKQADFVILDVNEIEEVSYHFGANHVLHTYKKGEKIV